MFYHIVCIMLSYLISHTYVTYIQVYFGGRPGTPSPQRRQGGAQGAAADLQAEAPEAAQEGPSGLRKPDQRPDMISDILVHTIW